MSQFILLRKLFVGRVTRELLSLMDVSEVNKFLVFKFDLTYSTGRISKFPFSHALRFTREG